MIRLIGAEFKKVFSKKAVYVMFIIGFAFCILNNVIYRYMDNLNEFIFSEKSYYQSEDEYNMQKEFLKDVDYNNVDQKKEYIAIKTDLEIFEYCLKVESWQCDYFVDNHFEDVSSLVMAKLQNSPNLTELENNYQNILNTINSMKWEELINQNIETEKSNLTMLKDKLSSLKTSREIASVQNAIYESESKLLNLELRYKNNVRSNSDDLANIIDNYTNNLMTVKRLELGSDLSEEDEDMLLEAKASYQLNKYYLDNDIIPENTSKANQSMSYFVGDYNLLIMIFIVIISGGIMADEYHKGTIKQLLIKPYKRTSILLSKFITTLLLIPIIVCVLMLLQIVVGGIINGFDFCSQPIILFNYAKEAVTSYNVFIYVLITFVSKLPYYILMALLSFAFSTIFGSTALATCAPLFIFFVGSVINAAINAFDFKWLGWFITNIWDWTNYLTHSNLSGILNSFQFCIVMSVIYFIVILSITTYLFNKKDIKNV